MNGEKNMTKLEKIYKKKRIESVYSFTMTLLLVWLHIQQCEYNN